jgi:hypothetical protein
MRALYWLGIASGLLEIVWGITGLVAYGGHPYAVASCVITAGPGVLSIAAVIVPRTHLWAFSLAPQLYFIGWGWLWIVVELCGFVSDGFAPAMGMSALLTDMATLAAMIAVGMLNLGAVSVYAYMVREAASRRRIRTADAKKRRPYRVEPDTGIKAAPSRSEMIYRPCARQSPPPQ